MSMSLKRTGRDRDGRVIILPPTTADEHIAVQRESKARITLLHSIPDDHVVDFHYMDDARDIWNVVKARFSGNAESKKMRKSMLKQEFSKFRIGEAEGLHKGYDRMQKILSGLELLSFDDLDYKLKTLEVDVKGYTTFSSSQSTGPSHYAFVSTTSANKKMSYGDSPSYSLITSYTTKEFGMIASCDTVDAIKEGAAKIYNLITGADIKEASTAGDAREFALMGVTSEVHNCPFVCDNKYNDLQKKYNELNEQNSEYFIQVQAYKNSLKTLEKQKRILQINQLTLEDKIRVLSVELKNTSNLLKHFERINADVENAKKELQTKLDNHLVQTKKWRISSKNLFRLLDSSMSVRTKVGLRFNNYIRENELGWDDSAFSVFTTNSEDVEGRPLFNRFAKADSMKVMPPPLSRDYTSLSNHIDLDESQMSYGTKSSTSSDFKSVSNDFVSYDDSDMSLEVNTKDFASSDSSVKSSEPKPNDSTFCASTSSVSTSENEAEIESNVGTPIQEPIIVQDLPSFSCNKKKASSVSKLCFVCGSGTHHIKDYDFYEKKMVNKTVGIGVGPVHSRNKVNHQNQFVLQVVLLRAGKVNIPPARPQPVPTGKPKLFAPVSIGRRNRPFPIPTDRGYSLSVNSDCLMVQEGGLVIFKCSTWSRIDRSTTHFTTLREILHMVDRQDLVKFYGLVVKYYENHPVADAGLIFWRLYTLSNVHVLETVSGEVVYMFTDVSYPFSVKLMERMLEHKLEIDKDVVGNDMTTAEQLIKFIKNQLVAAQISPA
nr:xylulose kinase-1 [Tanacetum cinerariifolium]